MNNTISRKKFLRNTSALLMGGGLAVSANAMNLSSGDEDKTEKTFGEKLYSEFTEYEKQMIAKSKMAKDVLSYMEKGFSCSGCIHSAGLAYLGLPKEHAYASAAFGGGLGHFRLCGLLTGANMVIGGLAGLRYNDDRKKMKEYAHKTFSEYWNWYESVADLNCYENRPKYDRDGYTRMLQRSALKLEEILSSAQNEKQ